MSESESLGMLLAMVKSPAETDTTPFGAERKEAQLRGGPGDSDRYVPRQPTHCYQYRGFPLSDDVAPAQS